MDNLRKQVNKAPEKPGVYRWLNKDGDVLYVGKAKNLKSRLKSYVQENPDKSLGPWKLSLIKHIADLDVTVTDTELEALILETNLIKEMKPKYNVLMKDDKNYVYVRISTDEYPELTVVRHMQDDQAKYFGPYVSSYNIKRTLDTLHEIFHFRACSTSIEKLNRGTKPERACLQYQIGQCNGLCVGDISKEQYQYAIEEVMRFLRGHRKSALLALKDLMDSAAAEKKFERAAKLRDTLLYIQSLEEKQVVSDTSRENTDAIGIALQGGKSQVVVLRERGGKLIEERSIALAGEADSIPAVIAEFIPQYYSAETDIPDLVLIQEDIEDKAVLEAWLKEIREKSVEIRAPERGKKSKLLSLATANASQKISQQFAKWEAAAKNLETALQDLKTMIQLPDIPKRIEGYDISHLGGTETVGSMVVIKNGKPANKEYRSFTLRTIKEGEIDDYKAMKEVLTRRLRYLCNDEEQWQQAGITFGKARKAEEATLKEIIAQYPGTLEPDTVAYKDFIVARESTEKIIAFGAIVNNHGDLFELDPLWVDDAHRGSKIGQHICRLLLKKQKQKVYLLCKPYLEEYYAQIGFRYVREGPEILHTKIQDFIDRYPDQEAEIMMVTEPKNQKVDASLVAVPDLLVIDGGKGQLSAVVEVLEELKLNIPVIGLAKREEEVFLPGESFPVDLPKTSQASFLLQRLRDEAHRFSNAHREKRLAKGMIASALDEIPGIGLKTKADLLNAFKTVDNIKQASDEQLLTILNTKQLSALRSRLR